VERCCYGEQGVPGLKKETGERRGKKASERSVHKKGGVRAKLRVLRNLVLGTSQQGKVSDVKKNTTPGSKRFSKPL